MLNIDVNRSAQGVERYFDRELAVSDYLLRAPPQGQLPPLSFRPRSEYWLIPESEKI